MKKAILYIAFTSFAITGFAQDSTQAVVQNANRVSMVNLHPNKTNDQVLPRWALDVTYQYGSLQQEIDMIDLRTSHTQSIADSTRFSTPKFDEGRAHGANLQLGYFFGKNRIFGLGTGVSWLYQKGLITIDDYKAHYKSIEKATNSNKDTFRQILTNNGAIKEEVTLTNFNIPLVFKLKHQFKKQLGIAMDFGPFLGISAENKYISKQANFDYEAVYLYDGTKGTYDNTPHGYDAHSQLITEDFWKLHQTTDLNQDGNPDVMEYFKRKKEEGMNVALREDISGTTGKGKKYTELSWGIFFQPSLTYQLSYNTTFLIGGYYRYQVFQNENNTDYRLTDKVGEYNSITKGIEKNTVSSWGLNVGFRFFFGEKEDRDGDGVFGNDDCKLDWGLAEFNGCPDTDEDGIPDAKDDCVSEYGVASAKGCPDADGDGIKDDDDAYPNEPGLAYPSNMEMNGASKERIANYLYRSVYGKEIETDKNTNETEADKNINIEDLYSIVSKRVYFDFGKSDLLEKDYPELDAAVNELNSLDSIGLRILIIGHTDSVGTERNNIELSLARAETASQYLQTKGIAPSKIFTAGKGKKEPITSNDQPESRAMNRRAEVLFLSPKVLKKR